MGSLVLLNGSLDVIRACITLPRVGCWHAELEIDTDQASDLSGAAALSVADGAVFWVGSVFRGGVFAGRGKALLVGGTGGLKKTLPAKFYRGAPLRLPLGDALLEAGEVLSPTADPATLGMLLQNWTRREQSACLTVQELADVVGVPWRVLADGSLWIGPETWPAYTDDFEVVGEDPAAGYAEVDSDLPTLRPGQTLEGRKVGRVVHEFYGEGSKTLVWLED